LTANSLIIKPQQTTVKGEAKMKKRCSVKRLFVMVAPVAVGILMLCMSPAHAKALNPDMVLKTWLAQNPGIAASAEDTQGLTCLVTTAIMTYGELAACKNDQACSAEVLYSNILDAILCVNPEAENIALLACTSDAVASYLEQSTVCGSKDNLCKVLNLVNLLQGFSGCFNQEQQ
jgi:hypothetical protein